MRGTGLRPAPFHAEGDPPAGGSQALLLKGCILYGASHFDIGSLSDAGGADEWV
jgi:hypothetical protein